MEYSPQLNFSKFSIPVSTFSILAHLKSKLSDLELAIDGKITEEQAIKIRIITSHYDALTLCKSDLEKAIIDIAESFKLQQELIQTVPGCAK